MKINSTLRDGIIIACAVVAAVLVMAVYIHFENKANYEKLAKLYGEENVLKCDIKGKGWTLIHPSRIVGYDRDQGLWIFTNGSAKNCEVMKK